MLANIPQPTRTAMAGIGVALLATAAGCSSVAGRPLATSLPGNKWVAEATSTPAGQSSATDGRCRNQPQLAEARPVMHRLPLVPQNPSRKGQGVHLVSHVEMDNAGRTDARADLAALRHLSLPAYVTANNNSDHPVPIDLANALAMGGASHLEIRIARQRVIEAQSALVEARAIWLPSLRAGLGWTKHDGRIQATEGDVLEVSRNSLFVGGGAGYGMAPLTGGSGGPIRLMVNLSLADAIFEKHVACWLLNAERYAASRTYNDSLLEIAFAYFDLLEAHGLLANARVGESSAARMVELTEAFEREGEGNQADVDRAKTEHAFWQLAVEDTQRKADARSAELIRLLRLDPQGLLVPVEEKVAPIVLVDPETPLVQLIARGLRNRPELDQHQALVQATLHRMQQEHWRPVLPNVQVGASGGAFGGGQGSNFDDQGSRSDVDILAIWELRGLGMANLAAYRGRVSQVRQARLRVEQLQDKIVAEIVTAARNADSYQRQTDTASKQIVASGESYRLNLDRVAESQGLPIELLQAIRAHVASLDTYTRVVADYSRGQYRLYWSLGRSPTAQNTVDRQSPEQQLPPPDEDAPAQLDAAASVAHPATARRVSTNKLAPFLLDDSASFRPPPIRSNTKMHFRQS